LLDFEENPKSKGEVGSFGIIKL